MPAIQKKQVIIIGAGIAGLKAASDLYRNGVHDILILEARNRIGGRLLTIQTPEGNTYDLGASWFHDTLSNPLFQKYVLNQDHTQIYYDDTATEVYSYKNVSDEGESAGNLISNGNGNISNGFKKPKKYDRGFKVPKSWKLDPVSEELEKFIEMENFNDLDADDTTLYDTVIDYIYSRRKVLTEEQIKYVPELIRSVELWHGLDWKMTSSKYSIDDHEGRHALNLDGYSKILQDILSSIPEDVIKTGIQVKQIAKLPGNKVGITTSTKEHIIADYVIVTVPQSILALPTYDTGSIDFSPKLPPQISNPLEKMHFGALGKIFLEFKSLDEAFWDLNTDKFTVLAKPDPLFKLFARQRKEKSAKKPDPDMTFIPTDLHDKYYDYAKNPQNIPQVYQHPIMFLNYYTSKKVPTLMALTQSPVTNYIESASLEETWEFLKPALFVLANQCKQGISHNKGSSHHDHTHRFKSPNDLPIPKNIFKSNWTRDPFSRGSYAACLPGDDPTDLIISLSKGFGSVRFAGEHTIFEGAGCAHGAWLSGKREANFVLNEMGCLREEDTYIDED